MHSRRIDTLVRTLIALCALAFPTSLTFAQSTPQPPAQIHSLKITILSTMLADDGIGEWGFAALVESDRHKILFDTGARPNTVLQNARELHIDLSDVQDVILSHFHDDHTSGLLTLRREFAKTNPAAFSRVHVSKGIFLERRGRFTNPMIAIKKEYEATGGTFIVHDGPVEIFPGAWLTGPVPRPNPEKNYPAGIEVNLADNSSGAPGSQSEPGSSSPAPPPAVRPLPSTAPASSSFTSFASFTASTPSTSSHWVEDTVPDDQSLIFNTARGLVVLSGCGHSGVVNTIEYARSIITPAPVEAAIGGFHLFAASDDSLDWTASKLKQYGTAHLLGAHCTGIESVYRLRQLLGLSRSTCLVGTIGAVYTLHTGITTGPIAR